jgi:hypothetical protein
MVDILFAALDPCMSNNKGGCQQHCVNDNGRARCQCYPGYRLARDRQTCIGIVLINRLSTILHLITDVDECTLMHGAGCEHNCVNVHGSFR